jgi:hypothetical protein
MYGLAFLLVYSEHHHNLVSSNADELLNRSDSSSRQLAKQDHSVNVVVLEELDIGAHIGDLFIGLALSRLGPRLKRETNLLDVHL